MNSQRWSGSIPTNRGLRFRRTKNEVPSHADWYISSEHNLEDAHDEFFGREDGKEQRRERRCSRYRQTGNILQVKRNGSHIANHSIAVAEVGQRLDIGGAQKFIGWLRVARNPFLVESLDITLRQQPVVRQSFPLYVCHSRSEHHQRAENSQHEKS